METKKKNISISLIISLFTLVASFLTSFIFTKFLLSQPQIGDVNYGLKTTADSFISFVSVFTVGMSSTFIRFHKKYEKEEESVFSTFNLITSIISVAAVIFGLVIFVLTINNKILDPTKGVYTQQQVNDFAAILLISIAYISLSIALGNSKWYLESTKNIVLVRIINLAVVIVYPIISTIFVFLGSNMVVVTLIYSLTYLAGFISYLFFRIKKTKNLNFLKISKLKKSLIKEVVIFSFFVIVTSSIETFNHSIDKMILTISLESASLTTIYQLSMTLNQVLLSLADIIYAPFLPYIADDFVSNNKDEIQKTYDRVNLFLLLISFLVFTGFVVCGKEFVMLWVGEGKEMVYYFSVALFAAWPLYGMVKFSNSIQRLSGKHYKSTILFIISFLLHTSITFSFVNAIELWACIIGTTTGTIFLGISFIIYNKRVLHLKQKNYLFNLIKLSLCSLISIGLSFLIIKFCKSNFKEISTALLFLIEGVSSIFFFVIFGMAIYRKKVKHIILLIFNDKYAYETSNKFSILTSIKNRLSIHKDKINNFFPFMLILYFTFNFASYYLGGLQIINPIVSSSAFAYLSKFISYFIIISYGLIFILSNRCEIKFWNMICFASIFAISVLGSIVVPKTFSFKSVNDYRWEVLTTFNLGIKDIIIGDLNWLIDLVILFFYLYIFKQYVSKRNLIIFMRFIVVFTLFECLYSFIFQYKDYLYFFTKASGDTSFGGYSTNLSGTFSSKNGFGFLLFQSIIACFFLNLYENKINHKLYWAPFVLFNIVSIFSLCKTSMIASFIFDFLIFGFWINKQRKTNKKIFVLFVSFFVLIGVLVGLCFTPLMRKIPIINGIIKKINEMFLLAGDATIRSRLILWEYALKMVKGPYLIFGYGKTASSYFLNISSNFITHTFHNGLLDILCSFGIFGIVLYFYAIRHCFVESVKYKKMSANKILVVGIIITTLFYGLMENVYLLISSSSTMLVSNVVLALPDECDFKNRKIGEIFYEEINI